MGCTLCRPVDAGRLPPDRRAEPRHPPPPAAARPRPAGTRRLPDAGHPLGCLAPRAAGSGACLLAVRRPSTCLAGAAQPCAPAAPARAEDRLHGLGARSRRGGRSERDIHRAVIGEPPAAWEDSGARRRIRTLLATARRWRDGAAFQLLRPPRRLLAGIVHTPAETAMTAEAFPVPLADSGTPPESAIPGTSPPADPASRRAPIPGRAIRGPNRATRTHSHLTARYLRTPEAAKFLGLSGRTLEKHRTFGTGPAYRKLGGRVVYRLEDLQAWAEAGARSSTSDPGLGITTARGPGRSAAVRPAMSTAPLPATLEHARPRAPIDLMTWPWFSLAKTPRATPIYHQSRRHSLLVAPVPGATAIATIWDADILFWATAQLIQAQDERLRTTATLIAPARRDPALPATRDRAQPIRPPRRGARPAGRDRSGDHGRRRGWQPRHVPLDRSLAHDPGRDRHHRPGLAAGLRSAGGGCWRSRRGISR